MAHLVKRFREGRISVADFDDLKDWLESDPEVPKGMWFKRFPKFILAGEGEMPKTFLTREWLLTAKKFTEQNAQATGCASRQHLLQVHSPTHPSTENRRAPTQKLAARLKEVVPSESELAQHLLLAADIKRFLDRPGDPMRVMPAPDSPPGAPIGDAGMDWLSPAPMCTWSDAHPEWRGLSGGSWM